MTKPDEWHTCEACEGRGFVFKSVIDPHKDKIHDYEAPCEECGGEGKWEI